MLLVLLSTLILLLLLQISIIIEMPVNWAKPLKKKYHEQDSN